MTLRELIIKIGADTTDYDRKMVKSTKQLQDFGSQAETVGSRLTAGISLPLAAVGGAALVAAGKMEQTQVAFTTLLKSADLAKAHLEDLKKFTLVTPYQFEDVTKMSRLMQAMGTDARNVVPQLRIIGNAVSAMGGGGDVLERVVRSMSEIGTRGKITGEQLRELSRAGIPALEAIAQKLGVTVAEAQAKVTAGMVDAKTATDALLGYMEKRFAGGMEAQSQTLLGAWSNIKDKILFTMADIGQALLPMAKDAISNFVDPLLDGVKGLAEAFAKLPKPVQEAGIGLAGFAALAPPLIWGTGTLITNVSVIAGAFTKLGGVARLLSIALSPVTIVLGTLAVIGTRAVKVWQDLRKEWDNDKFISTARGHFVEMEQAAAANLERLRPLPPAFALIATKAKEAAPALEAIKEHFVQIPRVTLESAVNTELYNRAVARQSELIRQITDYRLTVFVKTWHSFIGDGPAVLSVFEGMAKAIDTADKLIGKITGSLVDLRQRELADSPFGQLEEGARGLGVTTAAQLDQMATKAEDDYARMRDSGVATYRDLEIAAMKAQKVRADADFANGRISKEVHDQIIRQLDQELSTTSTTLKKIKFDRHELAREVVEATHRMFDSLERDLARNIVEWKSWKDTVKSLWQGLASDMLAIMFKTLFKPLEDKLADILGTLIGGKKSGGGVLGTGVGAAGGAAGTIGGAASTSGPSAAGGIMGAASSSLTGILTAAFSGLNALFSGIGMFQNMHMETSLNAIEHNTRYSMMYLGERADGGILGTLFKINEEIAWGANTKATEQIRDLLASGKGGNATYNISVDLRGANMAGTTQASVDMMMSAAFSKALAARGA